MRLSDELAARRRLYSTPLITAPAVMLLDIPSRFAGAGLLLGRYYPVVLETLEELAEFERFLTAERSTLQAPDLLDRRASQLAGTQIVFFEYAPPAPNWPWTLFCHWPEAYASVAADDPHLLARGAYTTEAFHCQEGLRISTAQIISSLGARSEVRIVPPLSGAAGHA